MSCRQCPVCGGQAKRPAFPISTCWNGKEFLYMACGRCGSTFVDPVPDAADFEKMYSKENYHNEHYSTCAVGKYRDSMKLLKDLAGDKNTLLDFGCGNGSFIAVAKEQGFDCTGVEIDAETIRFAQNNSGCPVYTWEELRTRENRFDVIHLGDVLAHLPDPASLMIDLATLLQPGGLIFVEGPLENNHSLVYFSTLFFAWVKRLSGQFVPGHHAPTRLFFDTAHAQKEFFSKRLGFREIEFRVYETGWPYYLPGENLSFSPANFLKSIIGRLAVLISGVSVGNGVVFGNRFSGFYTVTEISSKRSKVSKAPATLPPPLSKNLSNAIAYST